MKTGRVHINEMRVRAPGLKPEQARRLGELVAQRLADARLGNQMTRRVPSTNVRLPSNTGDSIEVMANRIVAGIRNKLR